MLLRAVLPPLLSQAFFMLDEAVVMAVRAPAIPPALSVLDDAVSSLRAMVVVCCRVQVVCK